MENYKKIAWLEEQSEPNDKEADCESIKEKPANINKEYLYVMDVVNEDIIRIDVTDNDAYSTEENLKTCNLNIDNCLVMYSSKLINKITSGDEYLEH